MCKIVNTFHCEECEKKDKENIKGMFEKINCSIIDGNKKEAVKLAGETLEEGIDPVEAIDAFTKLGI
jgi:methanogenic corrinoid protein MtbC1